MRVRVPELLNRVHGIPMLIVDNISHDSTTKLILELQKIFGQAVSLISRQNDLSYAKSLLQVIKLEIVNGYYNLVQMDANGSHAPKNLIKLLSAEGDVVIGSRYLRNSNVIIRTYPQAGIFYHWNRLLLSKMVITSA